MAGVFRGADIDRKVARSYPVGQSATKRCLAVPFGADRGELRSGAENYKFAQLDVIRADLTAKFIEGGLDGRCFGDGVTAATCRH
ncbi:hypothetical protein [Mycobacterium sp.]|uniref:hypothetical protein n=1 Tax=Mycobacterium sp. TaxID=1785 RepID=UPI003A8AA29A